MGDAVEVTVELWDDDLDNVNDRSTVGVADRDFETDIVFEAFLETVVE